MTLGDVLYIEVQFIKMIVKIKKNIIKNVLMGRIRFMNEISQETHYMKNKK